MRRTHVIVFKHVKRALNLLTTGGGPISPAKYRRICQYHRKNLRNFTIFAKFLPVPISPKEPISPKLRECLMFLLQISLGTSYV